MSLQVNLTLSKTYFLPGELVQVCVQIFNETETESIKPETSLASPVPEVLHIKELSFQANGLERTDSSFVHRLHHQEVPAEITDSRKRVRSIFSTESAVLVSDKVLAPHAVQSFQLRFRLPSALPPTFRGSAVRFFYMIHVKAVYEVQRGKLDAVVYETTASTTLTVWPNNSVPVGMSLSSASSLDRRASSLDYSLRGQEAGLSDISGSDALPSLYERSNSIASNVRDSSRRTEPGHLRLSGAGSGPSTVIGVPMHATSVLHAVNSHGGLGSTGSEDGDVSMCDYVLGRNCRIRWQEIGGGDSCDQLATCSSLEGSSCLADGSAATGAALLPRGVIPFGVNRPFDAPLPTHPNLVLDTDSDTEDGQGSQTRISSTNGLAALTDTSNSVRMVVLAQPPSHVNRQLSGGAGGLPPFTRPPCRRSSLFGKVFMLNVWDQPLLRLLLHAPLEVPLQPGATFGGVLDFRQLQAVAVLPPASSGWAGQPGTERIPMTCYSITVLLETEEMLSPECRPQSKRDIGGASFGTSYIIRRLHAEHHELPGDIALTSFVFSLPTTATPSFRTPMVSLRWILRFELTVGPRINFASVDKRGRPMQPQLEHLVWSLPLNLKSPVATAR